MGHHLVEPRPPFFSPFSVSQRAPGLKELRLDFQQSRPLGPATLEQLAKKISEMSLRGICNAWDGWDGWDSDEVTT